MKILISSNPYLYTKRKHRKRVLNTPNNLHDPYNGYEYVDLGLPSGTLWATCNVGASKPEEYGMYFAWGETKGYTSEQVFGGERSFDQDTYNAGSAVSISDDLTLSQDAPHTYMRGDWRMPTQREFNELINSSYTTTTWTSDYNGTGVAGRVITSKTNGNSIFLPAAGWCPGPVVIDIGSSCLYWASTLYEPNKAYYLAFGSSGGGISSFARPVGYSVRGVIRQAKIIGVDLGLPSGTLWANCNVGAQYPEDTGLYFAWGETTGYTAKQVTDGVRSFDEDTYNSGNAYDYVLTLNSNNIFDLAFDAAHAYMGKNWRMPTKQEYQELIDNCTNTWTTNYNGMGVAGYIITSKSNGNSIFFPATGFCRDSSVNYFGYPYMSYWLSMLYGGAQPYHLGSSSHGIEIQVGYSWYLGFSVRGVIPSLYNVHDDYVDLGLPSGLKWATCNIGANSPEQTGLYFAWGETTGYTVEQVNSGVRNFDSDEYVAGSAALISTNLTLEQDAAQANLGGKWRMPTLDEYQELIQNTDKAWISDYNGTGVAGRLFMSKNNINSVFFPAAGNFINSSFNRFGTTGYYLSASVDDLKSSWGFMFGFDSESLSSHGRYFGFQVRGVCE